MHANDRTALSEWIQRVFALRNQYYHLIQLDVEQQLSPPATESAIKAYETSIGFRLPPSYRMFLLLHNGWRHWVGDTHLLSLEEQRIGPYAEWIEGRKRDAREDGETALLEGLVIAACTYNPGCLFLDTTKRDERDEMHIVNWEYSEIARYKDFFDLLHRTATNCEQLIASEVEEQGIELRSLPDETGE